MIIIVKLWNNNESKQRTITSCMHNLKAANQFPLQYNTLYENLSKEDIALISTNLTHPPLSQKCLVSSLVQLRSTGQVKSIWRQRERHWRRLTMTYEFRTEKLSVTSKWNWMNVMQSFHFAVFTRNKEEKKNADYLFATIYFIQNWNHISIILCA